MPEKPKPKREVALTFSSASVGLIRVYASKDAIDDLKSFGKVYHEKGDQYDLFVDSRYDFDEVLEYITNYG